MLLDAHVTPEFAGSHERALALVQEGSVAAAATYEQIAKGDASLRQIARSSAIPNEPIVVRRGLSDDVARKLVDALAALPQSADALAALQDVADITGFTAATETTFDGALATLRQAGRSAETLVPGGRALVLRNSPILNAP
jgi:ABC-type phosphate/phosphonate transport system substrate-binding protein